MISVREDIVFDFFGPMIDVIWTSKQEADRSGYLDLTSKGRPRKKPYTVTQKDYTLSSGKISTIIFGPANAKPFMELAYNPNTPRPRIKLGEYILRELL